MFNLKFNTMRVKIPNDFSKSSVENLMLKLFPEYKFKWIISNIKVRVGKDKGSVRSSAFAKKNLFNVIGVDYIEKPDGSKEIKWAANINQQFSSVFMVLTGILPGLVMYGIIYFAVVKRRAKEVDEIISTELQKYSN